MKNLSGAFRQALYNDDNNYIAYADIMLNEYVLTADTSIVTGKTYYTRTTVSGSYVYTVVSGPSVSNLANYYEQVILHLTNTEIWSGGFSYEEVVSNDDIFDAVGSAIVGSASLIIDNTEEQYQEYDYTEATVILSIGMYFEDEERLEKIQIGVYTVDETVYNGATIRLTLLDNMARFDKPYSLVTEQYSSKLQYPATLFTIVKDACDRCGVQLNTNSLQFPHYTYTIQDRPDDESLTFREVLSWAVAIAGCFAKCDPQGKLEIKWFNTSVLDDWSDNLDGGAFNPWTTGDTYDGGTFNPWSSGDVYDGGTLVSGGVHYIQELYSQNIAVDDVLITGVTLYVKDNSDNASQEIKTYTSGTSGYVIELENNDFITPDNASTILGWLATQLIGLRFRKLSVSCRTDPAIEAGDIALVMDRKQNIYKALVTRINFSIDGNENLVCGASTPSRNSVVKYSSVTKSYIELRKQLKQQKNDLEEAQEELAQRIDAAGGLYETNVLIDGATQRWLHDKPVLTDSEIVIAFTTTGITVSNDYKTKTSQGLDPTWYGLTVDGQLIASILSVAGINANWINTGAFTVKDANNNITFQADADTGSVTIKAANVPRQYFGSGAPTASNYPASQWNTDALKAYHEGDLYTDTNTKKTYKYTKKIVGSIIKFSDDSETEGSSWDYVEIYFNYNNRLYKYSKIGGKSTTNIIAGKEFFIPATEYKLYWHTDSSGNNYYGWRIASVTPTTLVELPSNVYTASSLPSGTTAITAQTTTPESEHNPYSNSLNQLWTVPTGNSDGYSYEWVEVVGIDAQEVMDEMTQQEIFDKLTNNGQAQGIYLDNGQLYILFTYAKGGTLTLGGVSNTNGVLVMNNGSNTEIGRWDKDGLSVAQRISLATTGSNSHTYKMVLDEGRQMYYDNNTLVASMYTIMGSGTYPFSLNYKDSFEIAGFNSGQGAITLGGGYVSVIGNFSVNGTKPRLVENTRYGDRFLYAYETPTPYFGDIGTGKTDGTGEAVINIDDIFDATVNVGIEYCVFLQKEGPGDLWVDEKESTYFVVKGEPDTKFSWEIKAVQKGYENLRLDDNALVKSAYVNDDDIGLSMDADLALLDSEDLFGQEDYL